MIKKIAYLAILSCFATSITGSAEEIKGAAATPAEPAKGQSATWAFQPVGPVAQPEVKQKKWVRTPIDAFVLAQLEAKGVKPSTDADRAVFIRRVTLDVTGVIPSPEEVKAFVGDRSPDAYEKLVDRLLASPHYGERQARRWLDLARYADSAGFTNDETRGNLWRYRDYVINAFNENKPYDRFIREQLAGDELWPNRQEALVATGFLRAYPDDSNSRNLVQKKHQNAQDMTDTVGTVFLASSIECGRCHNHKTDKVSSKEYYQLKAFFANVSASDDIPVFTKGQQELDYEKAQAKWEAATKDIRAKITALLAPIRKEGEEYHLGRFTPATQEALAKRAKPETATPDERWVIHRYLSTNYNDEAVTSSFVSYDEKAKGIKDELKKLQDELRKFDNIKPSKGFNALSAMTELGNPNAPATFTLFTGIDDRPVDEVQPGVPALYNPTNEKIEIKPTATSSGRRTALANWIASPNNPLTARVFVNRVWGQYFVRGIVETTSDFGKAGQRPTNPDLLDYLAAKLVNDGWNVKKLHREILLSSVYRQSSAYREDAYKADPENKLLAVFPRQRLEAEELRDSLLAASGLLEDKVGGPSVFPPVPATLRAGRLWQVDKDASDQNRRSVYIFTRRSVPYPLLGSFDMASAQTVHSKRDVTTSPLQALTLVNNDLVYQWSQNLAGRVVREAGSSEAAQLDRLYQILYARAPDRFEKDTLLSFLNTQENVLKEQLSSGKLTVAVPAGLKDTKAVNPLRLAALVDLTHTLVNANEFAYRY
jgi:hypothetical protein